MIRKYVLPLITFIIVAGLVTYFLTGGRDGQTQNIKNQNNSEYCDTGTSSDTYCAQIATTSTNGIPVTITMQSCGTNTTGVCFGSGKTNPETIDGITVYDLTSSTCSISYGISDEDDEYLFTVSADDCLQFQDAKGGVSSAYSKTYSEFRTQLLANSDAFIAKYKQNSLSR